METLSGFLSSCLSYSQVSCKHCEKGMSSLSLSFPRYYGKTQNRRFNARIKQKTDLKKVIEDWKKNATLWKEKKKTTY